jgi:sterol desaturase/sphingolipid hydroxylase (fatty acid hydroxylase superfamily)
MPDMPNPTQLATPLFIALVIAEMIFARITRRVRYEWHDTATSLLMGFGSVVVGAAAGIVFIAVAKALKPVSLAPIAWSIPAIAAAFIIHDFAYYWWHRASHRVRWLWASHVQHHSSQHYNLSTALRQPWTEALGPGFVFYLPTVMLGFPLPMLAFVGGLNLVYQFWIHTEVIGAMPAWFEAIFNTPSHHRVHHATNARYLDANYAGVFIIWDRLFGTFVREEAADPPRYGIVKNLGTFNPLKVALHEWVGIAGDLVHAGSLRERLLYLFAPPGWSPDGSRDTSDSIKALWKQFHAAAAE